MALSLTPPHSSCFYARTSSATRLRHQDLPAVFSNERRNSKVAYFKEVQKRFSWRPKITMMPIGVPRVIVKDPVTRRPNRLDIFEALQKERIVFISDIIHEDFSNKLVATLLYLDGLDSSKALYFFINCKGGDISPSLAIYDAMQFLKSSVATRCIAYAFDISGFILAAGKKGNRSALQHSRIVLRPPVGEAAGQADDVVNEAKQLIRIRDNLFKKLAKHTGQPEQKIFDDLNNEKRFSAQEAVEYGIIDQITMPPKRAANLARKKKPAPGLG